MYSFVVSLTGKLQNLALVITGVKRAAGGQSFISFGFDIG